MSTLLLALVIFLVLLTKLNCLRDKGYEFNFVPDYSERYYYRDLKEKFHEVMSINNCTTSGINNFEYDVSYMKNKLAADINVEIILPPSYVREKWGNLEMFELSKVYIQTTPSLCISKQYISFKRGMYKNSKGCFKTHIVDTKTKKIMKRIKTYPATLHSDHIRCASSESSTVCVTASKNPYQLPQKFRYLNRYPFLVTAKNLVVSRSGMLVPPCGPVGLFAQCEAVNWGVATAIDTLKYAQSCRDYYTSSSSSNIHKYGNKFSWLINMFTNKQNVVDSKSITSSNNQINTLTNTMCPYEQYNRVFVMAQYDDTQIGQFMQESLPKLVYHLEFLLANPDIKILYGFTKKPSVPAFVLPFYYFKWLGLYDRIINGTVYANEAFMPREGKYSFNLA